MNCQLKECLIHPVMLTHYLLLICVIKADKILWVCSDRRLTTSSFLPEIILWPESIMTHHMMAAYYCWCVCAIAQIYTYVMICLLFLLNY